MTELAPGVRYSADDELVVSCPKLVHLERMSNGSWWLGITLPNGETLHVDLATGPRCRHKIQILAEFR